MRPTFPQLYPLVALIVLGGATLWLERATRDDDDRARAEVRRDPDFTAEQTRLISFGADGKQRYELLADRIAHYPASNVTELERPRLRYDAQGRELHISANTGEVLADGDEILLSGEVRGQRAGLGGSPPMSLASATLRIWPNEDRAETHDSVVLTEGATTVHAGGLKADNIFGILNLLDGVTAVMPRTSRTTP